MSFMVKSVLLILSAATLAEASILTAQANESLAIPTMRVTTRLIYVDVVVRDRDGRDITGLTKKDFVLKEDGRPQETELFEHPTADLTSQKPLTAGSIADSGSPASDRSNEFTNVSPSKSPHEAANIVLLDLVNTPPTDQIYALKELVAFLKTLPAGHQVALFLLTDRLHMLQNFTGSSERLAAAASRIQSRDISLILSEVDKLQFRDFLALIGAAMGSDPGNAVAHLQASASADERDDLVKRARITEQAFAELANAIAGYAGRKNLLWLAEDFPIGTAAQVESEHSRESIQVRKTANLIASSQIAVYPISLAGVQPDGVGTSVSGVGEVSLIGGPPGFRNPQMGGTLQNQFNQRQALYSTMSDIAQETGGKAYRGTNDLVGALRQILDDGSNSYTLAYRSSNPNWDGQFRKISVNLARKGYTLSYRRGYFAVPESHDDSNLASELNLALQPETLEYTMLRLNAKLTPPDSVNSHVAVATIDSTLDASDLAYTTDAAGHRHAQLLVTLVALKDSDKQAKPLQISNVMKIDLDSNQYESLLKKGLRFREQLPLSPGVYRLRLGVAQVETHRIGTLELPVTITQDAPSTHLSGAANTDY